MSTHVTRWRALGTTAEVVVLARAALLPARAAVERELQAIDKAASRFRDDSELTALNARAGQTISVSPLLAEALAVALDAARRTGGAVDPTVGAALIDAGYDRTFDALQDGGTGARYGRTVAGWETVRLDRARRTVHVPAHVRLDLGATAKALAADRAARAAHQATQAAVLVSLGGDVAVAGPTPHGGWPIGIADAHDATDHQATIAIGDGGLTTSSTTQRRWARDGEDRHHVIDPRTGRSAESPWRTVSVAASSCVLANTCSTAALIWGDSAPEQLEALGVHARLVTHDGAVAYAGAWPRAEALR